jgi:hypothetical protein
MTLDFFIQTAATVLLLVGLWVMGNMRRSGVLMAFAAEGFTTAVGIMHHVWSIVVIGAVLFVVQGRNLLKWSRDGVKW